MKSTLRDGSVNGRQVNALCDAPRRRLVPSQKWRGPGQTVHPSIHYTDASGGGGGGQQW